MGGQIDWGCADCGVDTKVEYYMVHKELWKSATHKEILLCVGCLEKRIGRRLTPADFTDYPVNKDNHKRSDRLRDRMGI